MIGRLRSPSSAVINSRSASNPSAPGPTGQARGLKAHGAIRRPVLVALGLRPDYKEVIDCRLAQSESAAEWERFLGDLIRRVQQRLFTAALDELASIGEPINPVLEVDLDGEEVTLTLYDLPSTGP